VNPPPTFLGRAIKPFLLMMTLTMVIVAQANFRGIDRGTQYPLSIIVGSIALAAAIALLAGWAGKLPRLLEYGLLGVVLAYSIRAWFVMMSNPWDQAVFFSLAAVIGAGGAYFMEVAERHDGGWGSGE
jgi:hypothetical protein